VPSNLGRKAYDTRVKDPAVLKTGMAEAQRSLSENLSPREYSRAIGCLSSVRPSKLAPELRLCRTLDGGGRRAQQGE
jgi:hypothetical protein